MSAAHERPLLCGIVGHVGPGVSDRMRIEARERMDVAGVLRSEQARYLAVGGWNTMFGLAAFTVLYGLLGSQLGYGWILLMAQIIATIQAHFAQRRLVWKSRGHYWPELLRFSLVYGISYFVNLALLAFLVEVVGWPVLASQFVVTGLIVVLTFVINRTWTFRERHHGAVSEATDPEGPPR